MNNRTDNSSPIVIDYDPSHSYALEQLLCIEAPPEPDNFSQFWQLRYKQAIELTPNPTLTSSNHSHIDFECYDVVFRSFEDFPIAGWFIYPKNGSVKRAIVVGHGYGGRDSPDFHLPITDAAFLFPCFRGLSRSRSWPISEDPYYHVLHDIDKPHDYILGKCVADLWLAVSAIIQLIPEVVGHIAYLGTSFGGGIGALALPWERRIQRAHFRALQDYQKQHSHVLETLSYYDAAVAARHIDVPVHIAAALADPVVAPVGQYSIYNAIPNQKQLFVLQMGHAEYFDKVRQDQALLIELKDFFDTL
jgi:cephalosporin-C deacetylase